MARCCRCLLSHYFVLLTCGRHGAPATTADDARTACASSALLVGKFGPCVARKDAHMPMHLPFLVYCLQPLGFDRLEFLLMFAGLGSRAHALRLC